MKLSLLLSLLCLALPCAAQDTDTISSKAAILPEAIVRADRLRPALDRFIIYPTQEQRAAMTDGYHLLHQMALPRLQVNEVTRSVTVAGSDEEVQLRINGTPASKEDMIALQPNEVRAVEYIREPGVRYGDGVAAVINFVVHRITKGFTSGINLKSALTMNRNLHTIFTKLNTLQSQWSILYSLEQRALRHQEQNESNSYLLADDTKLQLKRHTLRSRDTRACHTLQFGYNLSKTEDYCFQVTFDGSMQAHPKGEERQSVVVGNMAAYTAQAKTKDEYRVGHLNLFFETHFSPHQTLTIQLDEQSLLSDYRYSYDALQTYGYTADGRKHTLKTEIAYEQQLSPFKLTIGGRYDQQYAANTYTTETTVTATMRKSSVYAYAQIQGKLAGLTYQLGSGISRQYSRQTDGRYTYLSFRPKLLLSYPLFTGMEAKYDLQVRPYMPNSKSIQITLRENEYEINNGNPNLRAFRSLQQCLELTFQRPRLLTQGRVLYHHAPNSIQPFYERIKQADGSVLFASSFANQSRHDQMKFDLYAKYDIIPQTIFISAYGCLDRFFVRADTYRRTLNSWSGQFQIEANCGRWQLSGTFTTPIHIPFGQNTRHEAAYSCLAATYRLGLLTFGAQWAWIFQSKGYSVRTTLHSPWIEKSFEDNNRDMSNLFSLNLVWRLTKGRKYEGGTRPVETPSTDTDILK